MRLYRAASLAEWLDAGNRWAAFTDEELTMLAHISDEFLTSDEADLLMNGIGPQVDAECAHRGLAI